MTNDERRAELRARLIDLLCAAVGDRFVPPDAIVGAGLPRQFAEGISRESRAIRTDVEAVEAAELWATKIAEADRVDDLASMSSGRR